MSMHLWINSTTDIGWRALAGKDRARCLIRSVSPSSPGEPGIWLSPYHGSRREDFYRFVFRRLLQVHSPRLPSGSLPYYDCPPTPVLPPVRSSPALLGGALLPRVLPPIRHLAYAGCWSLLGAFPQEGASHFGVCSGSGLGGFAQGLPRPTRRSPSHPVQGFPCPLRWTLQHGLGGGLLPSHTALCGSPPGTEVNQVDSFNLPVAPCNAHCRLPSH